MDCASAGLFPSLCREFASNFSDLGRGTAGAMSAGMTQPNAKWWCFIVSAALYGCGPDILTATDPDELDVDDAALATVEWKGPLDGDALKGTVTFEVRAPTSTHDVTFFVGKSVVGVDRDGRPWTVRVDTALFTDGVHELTATARYSSKFRPLSASIEVTLRNGRGDAGTTVVDAGSPVIDAGIPVVDAGPTRFDAGTTTSGIWISRAEIMALPMSGAAWTKVKAAADQNAGTPVLSNQDQNNNVLVLAKALVFARTSVESYRTQVRQNCMAAIDTELGGRTLALGRELAAYVIAADLVGLEPSSEAPTFRAWLVRTLNEDLSGMTLISTHEDRPNNWGTHAGASRAAVAAYLAKSPELSQAALGRAELERTAKVFKGWLGDRTAYAGFSYGDLSWQVDASKPVGVNAVGATKNGQNIDGALPDDMRRGCSFAWPPCFTDYAWEALQGATVQAELLHRAGFDAWNWEGKALLRAAQFLQRLDVAFGGWWAQGDDTWNPWLVNHVYGSNLPRDTAGTNPGKNLGFTDWTHDRTTRPRL